MHALRSEAGRRQPLQIFSWGTPSALRTEEGLALLAEERAGLSSPREDWQQNLMLLAVSWAREHGFREVYQRVLGFCPPSMAWNITLRVKRGLLQPRPARDLR